MKSALVNLSSGTQVQPIKAMHETIYQDAPDTVMTAYLSDDDFIPSIYNKQKNLLISNDTKTKFEVLEMLENFKESIPSENSAKAKFQVEKIL